MNSLERIMATITGEDADYQPFTLLLSLFGASLIKADTHEYYRNPNLWFEGQKAAIDIFDPDILITPFSITLEGEAFGSELVLLNKYAPNIKKPFITDLTQFDQLQAPDFDKSEAIQFLLKATDLIAEKYKETKAIAAPIASPCDTPALLMGVEMWIDTLLFNPKKVELILKKTTEHFVRFGNEYLARGASFLVIPVDITSAAIISEKIFKQLLPYFENTFNQIKGPIVIHSGGTKILPFLDRFAKLPNVIGCVLEHTEKFETARQIVGDKMVLMGNIDGSNFNKFSIEKIKEKTLEILNNRKNDKHFIFASSNADIPYDTPFETIQAVVDTIRNFKKY
ncbi:MAG: uroporphyrinogen decarboxylase family protein [Bacteroidales bacterium]|nr:uroporphyrinogen decarboxylase family protein [Bacteroidales bacterium]